LDAPNRKKDESVRNRSMLRAATPDQIDGNSCQGDQITDPRGCGGEICKIQYEEQGEQ